MNVRNVHEALPTGLDLLHAVGVRSESRNGPVIRCVAPVATVYHHPMERVEIHPWRDSNPFFHFYESLWMLAGRQDIKPLTRYVKRMATFSDDGVKQNAAYGYRWRSADLIRDQLVIICDRLKTNPSSRQEVLQIWNHRLDLGTDTKDHACNIAATFQIFGDKLDMVVFCRSNDAIWGAHGSNAVHFSMLQEYVARRIGVAVGTYTQISVNYHAYTDVFDKMREKMECGLVLSNPYERRSDFQPFPIARDNTDFDRWDRQCRAFITEDGSLPDIGYLDAPGLDPFFNDVAWPIVSTHDLFKKEHKDWPLIFKVIETCAAGDWRIACRNWLLRRWNSR